MKFPQNIKIGISGIRGLSPDPLNENVAYAIARSYAESLPDGAMLVSRDPRATGKDLKKAVIQGFLDAGKEVLDADIIPISTTQIAVREMDAVGAIDVTASHNPIEYNGLKLMTHEGRWVTLEYINEHMSARMEELLDTDIEYSLDTDRIKDVKDEAEELHFNLLRPLFVEGKKLTVALDATNGAASTMATELLEEMGCEVIPIATDPTEPFPRIPEPLPENLGWTLKKLEGKEYDLCAILDPDGDRIVLIDENGQIIMDEHNLPLILKSFIAQGKAGSVVINLSTSQIIEYVAEGNNVTVERSAVGDINVTNKMEELGAFFGGEGNGGIVDPSVHYGKDGLTGLVHIINCIRLEDKPLSEIVADLPSFEMRKEKLPAENVKDREDFYNKVYGLYPEAEPNYEDGLRLKWADEGKWIHLRPSNTEPIFRIIGEAKTADEIDSLIEEIRALLS